MMYKGLFVAMAIGAQSASGLTGIPEDSRAEVQLCRAETGGTLSPDGLDDGPMVCECYVSEEQICAEEGFEVLACDAKGGSVTCADGVSSSAACECFPSPDLTCGASPDDRGEGVTILLGPATPKGDHTTNEAITAAIRRAGQDLYELQQIRSSAAELLAAHPSLWQAVIAPPAEAVPNSDTCEGLRQPPCIEAEAPFREELMGPPACEAFADAGAACSAQIPE